MNFDSAKIEEICEKNKIFGGMNDEYQYLLSTRYVLRLL